MRSHVQDTIQPMPKAELSPSIDSTAFACPHCSAYTTQHWHRLFARQNDDDDRTPSMPTAETRQQLESDKDIPKEARPRLIEWCDRMMAGLPNLEQLKQDPYIRMQVENVNLSRCFNCKKIAVWVHRSMVFPLKRLGPQPNEDIPEDIIRDFEEARTILSASPRGAAALLRLAVQKLCAYLGELGKNIDDDIASLVAKGLDPLVQQSLDIVRVVGNEAVHPGTIDLRDDQGTAQRLFELVNIIAQQMISHPKAIRDMYEKLPEAKRKAIDARNARAKE